MTVVLGEKNNGFRTEEFAAAHHLIGKKAFID